MVSLGTDLKDHLFCSFESKTVAMGVRFPTVPLTPVLSVLLHRLIRIFFAEMTSIVIKLKSISENFQWRMEWVVCTGKEFFQKEGQLCEVYPHLQDFQSEKFRSIRFCFRISRIFGWMVYIFWNSTVFGLPANFSRKFLYHPLPFPNFRNLSLNGKRSNTTTILIPKQLNKVSKWLY